MLKINIRKGVVRSLFRYGNDRSYGYTIYLFNRPLIQIIIYKLSNAMITKKKYEALVERQKKASASNDYSKMIIDGDKNSLAMKEYFREKICKHTSVSSHHGGQIDRCDSCGKEWG